MTASSCVVVSSSDTAGIIVIVIVTVSGVGVCSRDLGLMAIICSVDAEGGVVMAAVLLSSFSWVVGLAPSFPVWVSLGGG